MIKMIFDRYYLAIYRGYDNHPMLRKFRTSRETSSLIAFTLAMNILSFVILIDNSILRFGAVTVWVVACLIITPLLQIFIELIYNKKRREKLLAEYENETFESRRCGAIWTWVYEILSVTFLIFLFLIS